MLLLLYTLLSLLSISIVSTQKNEACPNDDFTFIAKHNGKIPSEFAVSYISYGTPGHYSITIASDKTGGSVAQVENLKEKTTFTNWDAPYGKCTDDFFGNSESKFVSAVSQSHSEKQQEEVKIPMNKGGCCFRLVNTNKEGSKPAKNPLLPQRIEATVPDLTKKLEWNVGMLQYIIINNPLILFIFPTYNFIIKHIYAFLFNYKRMDYHGHRNQKQHILDLKKMVNIL